MSNIEEQFARFREEHSRIYAPEAVDSGVTLEPLGLGPASSPRSREKSRHRKKKRGRSAPSIDREAPSAKASSLKADDPLLVNLPDIYLRKREQRSSEQGDPLKEFREPEGDPDIEISSEPPGQVPFFKDARFDLTAPGAQRVEAVWQEDHGGTFHRADLDHVKGSLFSGIVGLDDGDYLLGFNVDGDLRPHPHHAQQIVVRPDGIFSPMSLKRFERRLVIRNKGAEDEAANVTTWVPWIELPGEVFLPARQEVQYAIRLLPEKMSPGVNEAELHVTVRRDGDGFVAAAYPFSVIAEAGGAVPFFSFDPAQFDAALQGIDSLDLTVTVGALGIGGLTGMVYLPQQSEVTDFTIDADAEPFSKTFTIDTRNLPHRTEGAIKVNIITDCYLANYRQLGFDVPYRLVYLKKSVPALSFGRVRKGETAILRLEVERSDGGEVDLEVEVPEIAASCLSAFRARAAAYSFRFDTRALEPGARFSEAITLIDHRSGLRDQIKAVAEVTSQRVVAPR